jgi:RNA polymerase sigma-70 factor (ECF subfamily)
MMWTTFTATLPMPDSELTSPGAAEAALIEAARDGSLEAFGDLVTLHESRVLRTAWRLLGHVEDARDAAQEVFLRAYRARRRLDPRRDPAPWLYRITVNVCRTMLRRRRSRRTEPLGDVPEELAATGPGLAVQERRVEQDDARRAIHGVLGSLTPKERTVLVLRDLEELTGAEVAAALGCAAGTVRAHLSRARVKVAQRLAALRGVV